MEINSDQDVDRIVIDKKSKLLFVSMAFLIIFFILLSWYRFVIAKDYAMILHMSCDPGQESCFVYECDPSFEECSDDPAENIFYYKEKTILANRIDKCSSVDDVSCQDALVCGQDDPGCFDASCDPDTVVAPLRCSLPGEELPVISDGGDDVLMEDSDAEELSGEVPVDEMDAEVPYDDVPSGEMDSDLSEVE